MAKIDKDTSAVTRRRIVQYAGVVQDFNPVHYDDEFARKMGLPGIIAQGPLTCALVLDAVIGEVGADRVAGMKARLKAPVLAGATLHVTCDEQGTLSATVDGKEVLAGAIALKG